MLSEQKWGTLSRAPHFLREWRMVLIIIAGQSLGGHDIPFTVRFSRAVSLKDSNSRLELQTHSVYGVGSGFAGVVRREVAINPIGTTALRDGRVLLAADTAAAENPAGQGSLEGRNKKRRRSS
jgi:hypothetical protein